MTINQVITNLDNTILGKESLLYLLSDSEKRSQMTHAQVIATDAMRQFVEINLRDLRTIREDLRQVKA